MQPSAFNAALLGKSTALGIVLNRLWSFAMREATNFTVFHFVLDESVFKLYEHKSGRDYLSRYYW